MSQRCRVTIVEAPSTLGLRTTGVERLGQRLLDEGLARKVGAQSVIRIQTLPPRPERDPQTQTLNARSIAAWSPRLADAVESILDRSEFPLILGGDCSILLGSMLGLRRRGRYGLLFIDGHADFYQPDAEPTGEAASMDLALATGHGPEPLTNLEQRGPLVRAEDAVAFAFRDGAQQRLHGSQSLPPELMALELAEVRRIGIEQATRVALARLTDARLDGFFIHFDADALSDAIMPAVDYRMPDGLAASEAISVIRAALATGKAAGMEVTIYNPALDADGSAGSVLTTVIADAFSGAE